MLSPLSLPALSRGKSHYARRIGRTASHTPSCRARQLTRPHSRAARPPSAADSRETLQRIITFWFGMSVIGQLWLWPLTLLLAWHSAVFAGGCSRGPSLWMRPRSQRRARMAPQPERRNPCNFHIASSGLSEGPKLPLRTAGVHPS
jgi:hypothetical protein